MTEFDLSQIISVDADGDACGQDGCFPAEAQNETAAGSDAEGQDA